MRLNGSVQITRSHNQSYTLVYAPFGSDRGERPARRFDRSRDLEQFLAGALRIPRREILESLIALDRHGSAVLSEIWLSSDEVTRHGLGSVWARGAMPGALIGAPALA
jgi:hypothetical protein